MAKDYREVIRKSKILVVDDHRNIRLSLKLTLENEGAIVTEAESVTTASPHLHTLENQPHAFDALLFDIRMPDGNGLDLLKKVSLLGLASRVIMISGEGTMNEAFQATEMGAFDYIDKPFTSERILVSVGRCLSFNQIKSQNEALAQAVQKDDEILGEHPLIQELHRNIKRVAPTQGRVLILGESGTGKELIAKAIHRNSDRASEPLVKVNCAAIPHSLVESELFGHEKGAFTGAAKTRRGLFELADGGTLFLDEIGELSLDVQAKLLRVLQTGEFSRVGSESILKTDVRLLAATHRDLSDMVAEGSFREDLYYRLNVITLKAPPLRERGDDLILMAEHFLEKACEEHSIGYRQLSDSALKQLKSHHWPGNIRELKNAIERAAILSEQQIIQSIPNLNSDVPKHWSPPKQTDTDHFHFQATTLTWQEFHQESGREYLKYVLEKTEGNVSEAARVLCLERAYLHRLMKKLGVQRGVVVKEGN